MIRSLVLMLLAGLWLAPLATAQVAVIGGGLARECYEAALYQRVSPTEGEKVCTRALELEMMKLSNRTATYTNRGVLRMRAGKYDAALEDYGVAKRMNPELGTVYVNEGAALIFKKDFTAARVSLDKSIDLNPSELYAAHYNRAIAREALGDVEGAYYDFKKSSELSPTWDMPKRQLERFTVTTQ